jgi:transitional endoplasmic reticulum ATPase
MARKTSPERTAFAALGGVDGARDRLIEALVTPLRHPAAVARLGVAGARGFLLYGPPGVGKSLLVRAAAAAAGARLVALSAAALLALPASDAERALRAGLAKARQGGAAILFIDELELIAPLRAANLPEPQRNDRLVGLLLAEIDRLADGAPVKLVGATSRPSSIEPALLRPGRLDELVYVPVPDAAGRARVLELMTARMPLARDVSLAEIAKRTDRFTPADIEDLLRRAALHALHQKLAAKSVAMADFEAALAETRASVTEAMEKDFEKLGGEIKQNAMKLEAMGFSAPGQLKPVRDSKHG